jgi:drug/metabolite transporter (DMT)-like permease
VRVRLPPLAADGLLFLAALLWGTGFIAQRIGSAHLGPLTFSGLRFSMAALVLLPFVVRQRFDRPLLVAGGITGALMAAAAMLQQWGVGATTAGNAGFITSLYVVFVPLLGLFVRHRVRKQVWLAVALSVVGLWFLSVDSEFRIHAGDPIVLASALGWALHLLAVDRYSNNVHPLGYAFLQFAITGLVATGLGMALERPGLEAVAAAKWPILYGGVFPVCAGFTLQMLAQRTAPPTHASILLSLEAVFAMLFGVLFLSEVVSGRQLTGASLMFAGVIAAQLKPRAKS